MTVINLPQKTPDYSGYNRLGKLDKLAVTILEQIFDAIDNNDVMDAAEELYDEPHSSNLSEEEFDAYLDRQEAFTDKATTRAAKALINWAEGRNDLVALWATKKHPPVCGGD